MKRFDPPRKVRLLQEVHCITFPFPFPAGTEVELVGECRPGVYEGWAQRPPYTTIAPPSILKTPVYVAVTKGSFYWLDPLDQVVDTLQARPDLLKELLVERMGLVATVQHYRNSLEKIASGKCSRSLWSRLRGFHYGWEDEAKVGLGIFAAVNS